MSKDEKVVQAEVVEPEEEALQDVPELEESTGEAKAVVKEGAPAKKAPEEAAKKKAKVKKEKGEEEETVLEEKVVTLNLRHAYLAYSRKPTPRSVRLVKKAAGRVFKSEDIKIDQRLNAILWSRGKTKAERRVAVRIQKLEGGTVRVLPATE